MIEVPVQLITGDGFTAVRAGTCAGQRVLLDRRGAVWNAAALRRDLAKLAAGERVLVAAIQAGNTEAIPALRLLWDLEGRLRIGLAALTGEVLPVVHRTGVSIVGGTLMMHCWTCQVTLTRPVLDIWPICEGWEAEAAAFHRAHPSTLSVNEVPE